MTDTPIRAESAPENSNLAAPISVEEWASLVIAERVAYQRIEMLGDDFEDADVNRLTAAWCDDLERLVLAPVNDAESIRLKLDLFLEHELAHAPTITMHRMIHTIRDDVARMPQPPAPPTASALKQAA